MVAGRGGVRSMRSLRQVALLLLVTAARGLEVPPSDSSAGPSEPAEPPLVSLQSQLAQMARESIRPAEV